MLRLISFGMDLHWARRATRHQSAAPDLEHLGAQKGTMPRNVDDNLKVLYHLGL